MKRLLVMVAAAVALAAAYAAGERALTVAKLQKAEPRPVSLSSTVFEGEPVVNFNISVPLPAVRNGSSFCFGVKGPRDFFVLSARPGGVALEKVTGGIPAELGVFPPAGASLLLMVRGPLCGVMDDGGFRSLFVESENIPPRWAWLGGQGARVDFRPLAAVLFADSFMRLKAEEGEWDPLSGEWKIVSLPNPSRSANAFRLGGRADKAEPAFDLLDLPDWDNYRAEVNVRPMSAAGGGGLVFDWRGDGRYNELVLKAGEKGGSLSVVSHHAGKDEVLGSFEAGFFPNQWYNLVMKQTFGRLVVEVNGTEALSLSSPRFSSGKFGLVVAPFGEMQFDDLDVRSLTPAETASLVDPGKVWHLFGPVEAGGQSFSFDSDESAFAFLPLRLGEGSVLSGELEWRKGSSGIILLNGMDAAEKSALLAVSPRRVSPGGFFDAPAARSAGRAKFTVQVTKGSALVSLRGDAVYHDIVPLRDGMLSFGIGGKNGFACKAVSVASTGRTRVVLWRNEIFTHESTMRNWNDDSLHWRRVRSDIPSSFAYVNDRICSRNLEATLNLTAKQAALPQFVAAVALPFEAGDFKSGYLLSVRRGEDGYSAVLSLAGDELWSGRLDISSLRSLTLYRRGRFVLAFVNGRYFRGYVSPDEPQPSVVGCMASPFIPTLRDVEISSDSVYEYLFNTAPSDWKVGAGVWEVLNRWQCDPRWSWFSGDSARKGKKITDPLALLWWRRRVKGDFTFEMYFGFKMDRSRGSRYSYARDVDVALVSDTADMDSGYQFIVGGKRNGRINAGSWVLRNGEPVPCRKGSDSKVSPFTLFTSQSHRFWFHYLLRRRGGRFTLQFTDQKGVHNVFDFTDSDPLAADRLGIWSYDCGLMLARVRIQTTGYAPPVDPREEKNVRPVTIYDPPDM